MRRPHSDLGTFLRSRRARLRPADAGLPDLGGRRRVPGLRREELARLAGISPGYYTRLEQGLSPNVSDAVLDAIARVLRLDPTERHHLGTLAHPRPAAPPPPEHLRPAVRTLVASLGPTPALVLGRRADVLAWNRLAHALLAPHLDFAARPNVARLVFLDPRTRELYGDGWPAKCQDTVADLRLVAGRHPGDRALATLIAELTDGSEQFAALWRAHPVRVCAAHTRHYRHPTAGPLTLADELLQLPDDPGLRLVLWSAEPGSPSATALDTLRRTARESQDTPS
ncbi:helix-turn-helix domain-containing protein [Streptomyces litchfieldiae]|uniref:Helix-turn-helix transcriptional regulator n=1 Tax=Streptomyces litchfieldiae TaxID=3075543 RepID=A0ABU2MM33_9ACTN|nr:helix-turn-helix transcriptional regulator [Streptomyces sp. DSM 44938]MDT0342179.1 helix-turn-helix transcriptional regulator [Streptomyces sp. DSM 44938]